MTRTLSALGSVPASRSVRSGRFYCNYVMHDILPGIYGQVVIVNTR